MKAIVWLLFGLGHLISKMQWLPGSYRMYNWLMLKSLDLQDRHGIKGPWSKSPGSS